ncbi:protein TIFY 10A isoform X2 [Ricinus communis]|uniref:protein TIFY 10A isoform X2 n=1 Tax=Ricinus communis TaxID=3988 RepID=UPI00201ABC72|nr:protein TIFY 10A isoform X2 [Ricinus communis]
MAGSPEFVGLSGQKTARLSEKNSFSQKCSLLSQYLKEKGSFGDLSLGITCNNSNNNADAKINTGNGNGASDMIKQTTTMNLFPMSEKHVDVPNRNMVTNCRSMDLFPQQSGFVTTTPEPKEDMQKRADSSVHKPASPESQNAQLTIFYAGQVIVFNDFPADKAKEVMLLATKGNSLNRFPSVPVKSHPPAFAPSVSKAPAESNSSLSSASNAVLNFSNNLIQERKLTPPPTIGSGNFLLLFLVFHVLINLGE